MKTRLLMFTLLLTLAATSLPAAAQQQYSASDSWTVGSGDYILQPGVPDCGGHEFDLVGAAAQAIAAYRMGGVYGSLASVLTTAVRQYQPHTAGTGGQILDQLLGGTRFANCVPVSVVIPAGARITGIQFQANDWSGSGYCAIGQDCSIGWSRFDPPQYFNAGDSLVVTSIFRNWSGDRERGASMTVFFSY